VWCVLKQSSSTAAWSLDSRSFLRAAPSSSSSPLPADLSAAARFPLPLPLDTGLPAGEHLLSLSSAAAGLASRSAAAATTALPAGWQKLG